MSHIIVTLDIIFHLYLFFRRLKFVHIHLHGHMKPHGRRNVEVITYKYHLSILKNTALMEKYHIRDL